jgi:hypothetical protein
MGIITKSKIAKDNDLLRQTLITSSRHKVVLTPGVATDPNREDVITAVRAFENFTRGNDPYGEHDFGQVDVKGQVYFWKIDYYDTDLIHGADPYEGPVTRVLTIMQASEY